MKLLTFLLAAALATACTSVPNVSSASTVEHPEARPFDSAAPASLAVDTALAEATETGKHAMIVMGADWCHDSRALAGWFETPRFEGFLVENYIIRYIDVGHKDKNLHIAKRFGLETIVGTPTVIVIDSQGNVLNLDTAPSWRNAASREQDAIYDYFSEYAPKSEG